MYTCLLSSQVETGVASEVFRALQSQNVTRKRKLLKANETRYVLDITNESEHYVASEHAVLHLSDAACRIIGQENWIFAIQNVSTYGPCPSPLGVLTTLQCHAFVSLPQSRVRSLLSSVKNTCLLCFRFEQVHVAALWLIAVGSIVTLTTVSYDQFREGGERWSPIELAAFDTLSRSVWGLAVGWMVIACQWGYAGIKWLLNEAECMPWRCIKTLDRKNYDVSKSPSSCELDRY